MSINETEVLEVLSVSSSEVEVCGDVAAQPIDREFEFRSDVCVQAIFTYLRLLACALLLRSFSMRFNSLPYRSVKLFLYVEPPLKGNE